MHTDPHLLHIKHYALETNVKFEFVEQISVPRSFSNSDIYILG